MADRMHGVVDVLKPDHLWINAQDGERYVAHVKETKAPGGHVCLLADQEVDFELFDYKGQTQARDVRLVDESRVELPDYEESTVIFWNGEFGFVSRNGCGCHLFIHKIINKHVRSVGDVIRHKLVFDEPKNRWEAKHADIIRFSPNYQPRRQFEEFHSLERAWRHKGDRNHHVGGLR